MQAGVGAFQKRFVNAAVRIWKGVRVKSSTGGFRVRSSQDSCDCTCQGSAGTIPLAQSLRDTRMPPHIGIKDRRRFGEGAEPDPRHCGTSAVYMHTVCMTANSTLARGHVAPVAAFPSAHYLNLHNDVSCITAARGDETALLKKRFVCLCSQAQTHNQFAA